MILDIPLLALGLALLILGGRALVRGATQLSELLGVPELVIGMTVVAFGTSAPELAVNILAAVRGNASIAFGNVIGSNIANVALIVGIAAIIRPLQVASVIVSREIPMMLLATVAAVVLGLDRIRSLPEQYDRSDGLMLLILFSIFLYYSAAEVIGRRPADPMIESTAEEVATLPGATPAQATLGIALGLGLLLVGAEVTVGRAVSIAEALGVSRALIGLTLVALGTSLPELATSCIAALKGQTSLAVGNVVGSNIFNLLLILAVTSLIAPIEVPEQGGVADLLALLGFSAVLLPLARTREACIQRRHGVGLVLAYICYMIWRVGL